MRKMATSAAITGGMFAVLFLLFSILSTVAMLMMSSNLAPVTALTSIINMVTVLLLGIALFRGKDVLCAVLGPVSAVLSVVASLGMSNIANSLLFKQEGMDFMPALLVAFATSAIVALLKKLPLAPGALAIGLSKDVKPAAP